MQTMEHRWGERFKITLPVRILAPCGLVGAGLVVDFSVSGAFIATALPVAVLSEVQIRFRPSRRSARADAGRRSLTFSAQVVRRSAGGFAVEWSEFGSQGMLAFANSNRAHASPLQHAASAALPRQEARSFGPRRHASVPPEAASLARTDGFLNPPDHRPETSSR